MKTKNILIPLLIILAGPVFIAIDIKTGFTTGLVPRPLSHYARLLANIGWTLMIAAAAYYVIRTYLVMMNKRSFTHKGLMMIQHLSKTLRKIHPFIGAAALALILIHGFFFAFRIFDFEVNTATVTGTLALVVFIGTVFFGIALYRKPGILSVRKMHRYAAIITIILVIVHLVSPE